MKVEVLTALNDLVVRQMPCAIVTDLKTGCQTLISATRTAGDVPLSPDNMAEAHRLMAADQSRLIEGTDLFVRVYSSPPRLIVVGAVHIAKALVPMARLSGFDVTIVDPRAAFVKSNAFDGVTTVEAWPDEAMAQILLTSRTAVVTLTHDPKLDDPALTAALQSPVFFIGALGSRKTHAKRLQRLKGEGFNDESLARIHGPVGLDINAVSPAEIAVSVMAQVVAELRKDVG